jgi:hypothetical protein
MLALSIYLMGWQCYSWKCFKKTLSTGISYIVDNTVTLITLTSIGKCKLSKTLSVSTITNNVYVNTKQKKQYSCLWRHLTNVEDYNRFYGTEPYIIEYPFLISFKMRHKQKITLAYKYLPSDTGVFIITPRWKQMINGLTKLFYIMDNNPLEY